MAEAAGDGPAGARHASARDRVVVGWRNGARDASGPPNQRRYRHLFHGRECPAAPLAPAEPGGEGDHGTSGVSEDNAGNVNTVPGKADGDGGSAAPSAQETEGSDAKNKKSPLGS